jgi:hypothetical protein
MEWNANPQKSASFAYILFGWGRERKRRKKEKIYYYLCLVENLIRS